MKVKDLRKLLKEFEIDDHGRDADIDFWSVEGECELVLAPQSSDEPGFEHCHYMGCGCISDITLNFIKGEE